MSHGSPGKHVSACAKHTLMQDHMSESCMPVLYSLQCSDWQSKCYVLMQNLHESAKKLPESPVCHVSPYHHMSAAQVPIAVIQAYANQHVRIPSAPPPARLTLAH